MRSTNVPRNPDLANLDTADCQHRTPNLGVFVRIGSIVILATLLVSTFYSASSASFSKKPAPVQHGKAAASLPTAPVLSSIPGPSGLASYRMASFPSLLPFQQPSVSVTTYASDCTTPKEVFNLQDPDLTVCAKVTEGQPGWRIIWSNAKSVAVQNVDIGNGTSTFTLTPNSSLGDWRVIPFEQFGGTVQAVASFTVVDAANPRADVSISKTAISSTASSGSQILFSVQVSNGGPSDAAAVQVTDTVPANTTFVSFNQLSGPTFNCTSPNAGESGDTACTITSLA